MGVPGGFGEADLGIMSFGLYEGVLPRALGVFDEAGAVNGFGKFGEGTLVMEPWDTRPLGGVWGSIEATKVLIWVKDRLGSPRNQMQPDDML